MRVGNTRCAPKVFFQHGDRALDQVSVAFGKRVSTIRGGRRAKIRNEAARKKLRQNTWPVERKSEQHDGRQANGFGPSRVYPPSQKERQRQGRGTDAPPQP